jgi:hypothetical protein
VYIVLQYLQAIIEILGLFSFSLALSHVNIKWKKCIIPAMVLAALVLIIRNLPVVFGMHILVIVIMMFIFITKMTQAPKHMVFLSIFVSIFFLAILEFCVNQLFIGIGLMPVNDAPEKGNMWLLMGYTQAILMNILAILIQLLWKPRYSWKSEAGSHEKNDIISPKS